MAHFKNKQHDSVVGKGAAGHVFWRDGALPFIEARSVLDGRQVCYERHAHEIFSIGVIAAGHSAYINGRACERVDAGTVVLMNPGDVHACNPIRDQAWSYRMLYVDTSWLARLQQEQGMSLRGDFRPFSAILTRDPVLYRGLENLYATLAGSEISLLRKQEASIEFFTEVQQRLTQVPAGMPRATMSPGLLRAAEYIDANSTRALMLDEICAAAQLSASYLIRAFKVCYGMTPHEYLVNRRIQHGRGLLKRGVSIAEAAVESGFSDQAHFQRVFKRLVAATPGQYRAAMSVDQAISR